MIYEAEYNTKAAKRSYSICSLSLFLSGILSLVGGVGLSFLFALLKRSGSPLISNPYFTWGVQLALMYGIVFPMGLLLMKLSPSTPPEKKKLPLGRLLSYFVMCFPLMAAGAIIGNLLSALISGGTATNPVEGLASDGNILRILITVVLAPLFEELLFRKFLIDRTAAYGERTAVIFSAVTFGLFHGNLFQFFYAAGTGLIFAYIYTRTGKVRYTVILHMMINFLGSMIAPWISSLSEGGGLSKAVGAMITAGYSLIYFALVVIGAVLILVRRRRIFFLPSPYQIPDGKRFSTVCLNVGSILFFLYCAFNIVLNLLPS